MWSWPCKRSCQSNASSISPSCWSRGRKALEANCFSCMNRRCLLRYKSATTIYLFPPYSLFLCLLFCATHSHHLTHTHTFLLSIQVAFGPRCHLSALAWQGWQLALHLPYYTQTHADAQTPHTHTLILSARHTLMRLWDHRRTILIFVTTQFRWEALHMAHTMANECFRAALLPHTWQNTQYTVIHQSVILGDRYMGVVGSPWTKR